MSGSDISQSSEICHGFFVKMTWIGCHVDGGWVRLLSGSEVSQAFGESEIGEMAFLSRLWVTLWSTSEVN